jgi:protein associated with RNAse G/E
LDAIQSFKANQREMLYNKLLEKALSLIVHRIIQFYEQDRVEISKFNDGLPA